MKKIFIAATFLLLLSLKVQAQELKPTEDKALVSVFVGDMNKKPRKKDIIIFEGINTKKVFKGITDNSGNFSILIPEGDTYLIKIGGLGDEEDFSKLELASEEGAFTSSFEILYEPAKVFELKDVKFNTGKYSLKPESYKALNDLVEILKIKSHLKIEIAGHTDNIGEDEANKSLSQKRALAVKQYLIKKGITASRLTAVGYGETEPIASNDTAEGRQENRRTEARIIEE